MPFNPVKFIVDDGIFPPVEIADFQSNILEHLFFKRAIAWKKNQCMIEPDGQGSQECDQLRQLNFSWKISVKFRSEVI